MSSGAHRPGTVGTHRGEATRIYTFRQTPHRVPLTHNERVSEQRTRTAVLAKRWQGLPTTAQDTAIAVLVGAVAAWFPALLPGHPLGWLAVVACTLPLVWRRQYPVGSALATGSGVLVADALRDDHILILLAVFAGASAAYHRPRLFAFLLAASAGWWAAYMYLAIPSEGQEPLLQSPAYRLLMLSPSLIPAATGYILQLRRERTEQHLRTIRSRFQEERLRERARIARDVHDIAGHHLSAIRLLAVGGQHAVGADSKEANEVLGSIAEVSGKAVREVRELLDLLRGDRLTEPPPPDVDLEDLPHLVTALDGTGVEIDLTVPFGIDNGVPARVRADAYRIIQESLSNVLRHSSARRVRVKLARTVRDLTVTVEDDGRPVQEYQFFEEPGHGLAGMRERAEALGGYLQTGHHPVRGWRVQAVLPFAGATHPVGAAAPPDTGTPGNEEGGQVANGQTEGDRT